MLEPEPEPTPTKKTDRLRNTEHAFTVMINYNILFYYQRWLQYRYSTVTGTSKKSFAFFLGIIWQLKNLDFSCKQITLKIFFLHYSSDKFLDGLLDMWTNYVVRQQGALVVSAMLDFLTFSLCSPYSETTDSKQFDMLLGLLFFNSVILFVYLPVSRLSSDVLKSPKHVN